MQSPSRLNRQKSKSDEKVENLAEVEEVVQDTSVDLLVRQKSEEKVEISNSTDVSEPSTLSSVEKVEEKMEEDEESSKEKSDKEVEPEVVSNNGKVVGEISSEPLRVESNEKQFLKKFRKQKKVVANEDIVSAESDKPGNDESSSVRNSVEEEEFENMGYVSGDDTTNYVDETYPKEVDPAKDEPKLLTHATVPSPHLEKKGEILAAAATVTTETVPICDNSVAVSTDKVEEHFIEASHAQAEIEKVSEAPDVHLNSTEHTISHVLEHHDDVMSGKEESLSALPQQEMEVDRPSCALENVGHHSQQQHMTTTDTQSLGVYTPDSATNSVLSIHAGYGGGEIGSSESTHNNGTNVMESPNSISSVEAVSLPPPPILPPQQQQMPHSQQQYGDAMINQQQQQQQQTVQNLVPPPFVGYGTPGPHHQVPTPPSPSINHNSQQQQQQQQQLSSPLMSAAPSPHQSQSLASASPHSQHNMTSPHPQPSPLSSPHPMTISPAAHSPYTPAHVPQPSPQGPTPQQQSQVRQSTRSPATHSVQHQHQQTAAANQMHQFQQLQRNLWQNYSPMNMAAAMGMTQQAACQLNRQLAAANFQAGAGMFPPTFTPPSMSLTPGIPVSSSAQKQHPSSHVGHHGAMASQQSSFYGQMANHHQPAPSPQSNRSAAAAGCLAKLQQLTNGLESPTGPPATSSNQIPVSNQSSSSSGRSASSKQSSRSAAAEQAARNAAALIPSGYHGYPTSHQPPSGPTPPPPSHTPGVVNTSSYYGRSDMSRAPSTGHAAPPAPPIATNHLMQPYGQNHHHMLNYTAAAGYGFMNQFMYHAAAADHQRSSAATPQPGSHGPAPPHPQHMYPGYPHLGYPTNYHR